MSDEIRSEVIEKTQKMLKKYISKPPLTEKLLKKPPFRFLHDVITAVIKDTGFLKGLFSETELISDNVKERDAKIAFLTKLIEAVKTITEIELKVKPTKVIAGLEPTETNKLLQALGTALDKKLDSTEYVKKVNSKSKLSDKAKKSSKTSVKDEKSRDSVRAKKHETETSKLDKTKKKDTSSRDSNRDVKLQEKTKTRLKKDTNKKEMDNLKTSPRMEEGVVAKTASKKIDNSHSNESKDAGNTQLKALESEFEQKENEKIIDVKTENVEQEIPKEVTEDLREKIRSDRPKSARPQSGHFKKLISNKVDKPEEDDVPIQKNNIPGRSIFKNFTEKTI